MRFDPPNLDAFRRALSVLTSVDRASDGGGEEAGAGTAGGPPPNVTAFVARRRERVASFVMPSAGLVVPIEGEKQLHVGGAVHRFRAGELLALRMGWRGDVVNEPDPETGWYRALLLTFPSDLVLRLRKAHPDCPAPTPRGGFMTRVTLTDALAASLMHVCDGLAAGPGFPARIVEHRIMEVMLLLAASGVLPLALQAHADGTPDAVRLAIRAEPDRSWTAALLAGELGIGEATLRRRLARDGTSLRAILLEERMAAAKLLLHRDRISVSEAAAACGYASRARFAKRFRSVHGVRPSSLTHGAAASPAGGGVAAGDD